MKPIWATSSGSTQVTPRSLDRGGVGERRVVAPQRAQLRRRARAASRWSKPVPDLAGVAQRAVVVVAEQQRAEVGRASPAAR